MNKKALQLFGVLKPSIFSVLTSTLFTPCLMAQEWPLGHQPPQYSVPQYTPDAKDFLYPIPQEPTPTEPAPNASLAPLETLPNTQPNSSSHDELLSQPALEPPKQLDPIEPANQSQSILPMPSPPLAAPSGNSNPNDDSKLNRSGTKSIAGKRYGLDYTIYRDYNSHPVDPRKPCNQCTHPGLNRGLCNCQWPGKNGQPYREREPGGCECSSASSKHHGNFSINWPGPFSALRESHQSNHQCGSQCRDQNRKRINDRFDHLVNWKLIDYKRTDNGYSGIGADPYGCDGESRVAGLQFRQPGQSVHDSIGANPLR